jgi:hypothetical protein
MSAALPVAQQIGVILKLAQQLSALVDQIGNATREDNNARETEITGIERMEEV